MQFDKITDLAGSANFIMIDLLTLFAAGYLYQRQVMVAVLVAISKFYLACYLLTRVLKRGHDARFDEMRSNFWAFLGFWVFQMLWAWGVSLPVMFILSDPSNPPLGSIDWGGLALFIFGFLLEMVGDLQKDAFRSNPRNKGEFMRTGLWAWSRHPNFCGEILMWWAIFIIGSPVFSSSASSWGYATVLSPLLTMALLLFLSGMPTAEGDNQKRFLRDPDVKTRYLKYRESTSPLIPMPPFLYASIPLILKRVFFFEFKMYETDWSYTGEDLDSSAVEAMAHKAPLTQRRSHESKSDVSSY
jgi:steroid 5-alpha reductase family enzyme